MWWLVRFGAPLYAPFRCKFNFIIRIPHSIWEEMSDKKLRKQELLREPDIRHFISCALEDAGRSPRIFRSAILIINVVRRILAIRNGLAGINICITNKQKVFARRNIRPNSAYTESCSEHLPSSSSYGPTLARPSLRLWRRKGTRLPSSLDQ